MSGIDLCDFALKYIGKPISWKQQAFTIYPWFPDKRKVILIIFGNLTSNRSVWIPFKYFCYLKIFQYTTQQDFKKQYQRTVAFFKFQRHKDCFWEVRLPIERPRNFAWFFHVWNVWRFFHWSGDRVSSTVISASKTWRLSVLFYGCHDLNCTAIHSRTIFD